jgi:imidazolonepropionase
MAATARLIAVVGCSELVTLQGPARPRIGPEMRELGIIRDGAFTVRDGRFEAVGTREEIERLITADYHVIDARGFVVTPGFVDAHTHPIFAGDRADELELRADGFSYEEIARMGGGIRSTVRRTRDATLGELKDVAKRHAEWFLRCGTTTIEAKSGYGLTTEDELKILRAMTALVPLRYVRTFLGAHIVPDEYSQNRSEYVELIIREMLPQVEVEYCDVFCERTAFTVEESERMLVAARELGLKLRIHADQLSKGGGAQLAARLGAVTADHLEHVDAEGIAALASAGVQPVLLPGAVLTLASTRYAPAREMITAGLPVVLATDFNPGSSPTTSMMLMLYLAVHHMKMTPAEAVTAATVNGAYSVGRGAEVGSIQPGKRADFVIHFWRSYRELAYWFGIDSVLSTYISGAQVHSAT